MIRWHAQLSERRFGPPKRIGGWCGAEVFSMRLVRGDGSRVAPRERLSRAELMESLVVLECAECEGDEGERVAVAARVCWLAGRREVSAAWMDLARRYEQRVAFALAEQQHALRTERARWATGLARKPSPSTPAQARVRARKEEM